MATTGFVARARERLFGSTAPVAQDPTPIRNASPADPAAPPPVGANMFTRAYDGFAVGSAWLSALATNEDSILKREGAHDLKLFDALLDDDVAMTAFQQRQLALVSRPWVVEPGNPDDPRSVLAADDLRDMMNRIGWDRVTRRMTFGIWYGYAVAEGLYSMRQHNGRTIVWLDDVIVPDRKWFAFTNAGELRMRSPGSAEGEAVPPNTFWSFKTGASHDFAHYGTGLAHWCYWPVWFKRNVLQFWALYLEKYGQPTVVGFFQPGSEKAVIDELLESLKAIGSDSAVALPAPPRDATTTGNGPDLSPKLMEATRSGGADSYPKFLDQQNDALRGVILGQPGTSSGVSGGLGSDQAGMHKDVRDEVIKADSDEIHESFNQTFPVWLTRWNHGEDVAPPTVYRSMDDGEDLNTTAERDAKLDEMGWRRTDDSFRETYGDGYERKPDPVPVVDPRLAIGANGGPPLAANDDDDRSQAVANFAANDDPAPLYVSRRLLNAGDLIKWAKAQGFTVTEAAADMHVTVLYSKAAVDWFEMAGEGWDWGKVEIEEGGPRAVVQLGDKGAVVLRFASPVLRYRHDSMVERGASSDFPDYKPHVTFTYDGSGVDLAKVVPFTGKLRFGPEIFERIDPPAPAAMDLPSFSAAELDTIDAMTAELVRDTDPVFMAMGEAIRDRLAEFTADGRRLTPDGLKIALLQAAERFDIAALAQRLALPLAAERAASVIGAEDEVGA